MNDGRLYATKFLATMYAFIVIFSPMESLSAGDGRTSTDTVCGEAEEHNQPRGQAGAGALARSQDGWKALIESLASDGQSLLATCAARAALNDYPHSTMLALCRARLAVPDFSLELLSKSDFAQATAPSDLRRAEEVISLGLLLPESFDGRQFLRDWSGALVAVEKPGRALKVLDEAMRRYPDDHTLASYRAMVLAMERDFGNAMIAQRSALFLQVRPRGCKHWGIADVLLSMDEPTIAVESFGDRRPSAFILNGDLNWLVLAEALRRSGKTSDADDVLGQCDSRPTKLIEIANLVEHGDSDGAKQVAQALFEEIPSPALGGSRKSPSLIKAGSCPVSIQPRVKSALLWLSKAYPEKCESIDEAIGRADRLFTLRPFEIKPVPSGDHIRDLQKRLAYATQPDDNWLVREELAREFEESERFADGANSYKANMLAGFPARFGQVPINPAAPRWDVCKRRAATIQFVEHHPERIESLWGVVKAIRQRDRGASDNTGSVAGWADKPTSDLLRSAVLGAIYDAIGPDAPVGNDVSTYLAAVGTLGTEQDVCVLIDRIWQISRSESRLGVVQPDPRADQLAAKCFEAGIVAIEKLTGEKTHGYTHEEQVHHWAGWWAANVERIARDK
jgi:hypothetical protein